MALWIEQRSECQHWAVWKIDETVEQLWELIPAQYRSAYREESSRFTRERRLKEWLAVRALLYQLYPICGHIAYAASGKPYILNQSYSLSISHTKGYVACMVGLDRVVGIDIEAVHDKVHRLADKFMRADETSPTMAQASAVDLLLHWSAKETAYKYYNSPSPHFKEYRVQPYREHASEGTLSVQPLWSEAQSTLSIGYLVQADFVLTWTIA